MLPSLSSFPAQTSVSACLVTHRAALSPGQHALCIAVLVKKLRTGNTSQYLPEGIQCAGWGEHRALPGL